MTNNEITIKYLLKALIKFKASDLHLKAGRPPLFRINGKLVPAKMDFLNNEDIKRLAFSIMNHKQISGFEKDLQIDFSIGMEEFGRFRVNVFTQRGLIGVVARMIPMTIPSLDSLSLPSVIKELTVRQRGLILITGATGSGKSTTMAATIQHINENQYDNIITIEDPIEFVYHDIKSSISQREIGQDCLTMADALRASLRQDPDVILVGEMRDFQTISTVLTAAETGHLVMSTLHTNDAKSAIERIIDVFPADSKNEIRLQLANSLIAVVAQKLVKTADGKGRRAAVEIMIKSPTIERLILENKIDEINEAIANSSSYYKMQTMNQSLEQLVKDGVITSQEALANSNNPDDLKLRLDGFDKMVGVDEFEQSQFASKKQQGGISIQHTVKTKPKNSQSQKQSNNNSYLNENPNYFNEITIDEPTLTHSTENKNTNNSAHSPFSKIIK